MKLINYYEDPTKLHVNTEKERSYYIPYSKEEYNKQEKQRLTDEYHLSDRLYPLSGEWRFRYYESSYDVLEEFYKVDFNTLDFDTIDVPSCIQIKGYDKHQYSNLRYPFPYDPPFVPNENPCAAYRREFYLTKEQSSLRQYLNFEGVDSCFYVWINDSFVGYSQVSHSTSEFDVTEYVKEGLNTIGVLVLKWCDGSYLEDQDKFRMTGIFRDVYLIGRPQEFLRDYFIHTLINEKQDKANVKVELEYYNKQISTACTLISPDNEVIRKKTSDNEVTFEVTNPILWNAESPKLYTLILETDEEVIEEKVGIRKIEISKGIVLLNDVAIKCKGVNRHDSDPYTGYTISREQAIKDLSLMKQHNVNAIRTSHYPNAPWFLKMCDEYGFYVIGESDIEAHSAACIYGGDQTTTFGDIVQREIFYDAIIDRVKRNVIRDKNCTSIIIWSLGNEAGYGKSFEDAGRWVKEYDPSRLLQYESSIYETGGHKNDTSMLDLYARMYASIEDIDKYFEDSNNKKPFLQIEFVHAMGNGPGDIEDYYEKIYEIDGFLGGFVWEWCDHAIYAGKTIEGKDKFLYGGDFKEFPHDGNFCVDGLVYPDRTVSTSLLELKNVIRPIRAYNHNVKSGEIRLENKLDFTNVIDYIQIEYEVTFNGGVIEKKTIEQEKLNIPAKTDKVIQLDYEIPKEGICYLNIFYKQIGELPFIMEGHVLGFDQILLSDELKGSIHSELEVNNIENIDQEICLDDTHNQMKDINVKEDDKYIILANDKFHYTFNKWNGTFDKIVIQNQSILNQPLELNIYRAPTDNDNTVKWEWKNAGYDRRTVKVYKVCTKKTSSSYEIQCDMSIAALFIQRILDVQVTYEITANGDIYIHTKAKKNMELPFLPRFGFRFFLAKEYTDVTYYGYGPYESYVDKKRASYFGKFTNKVKNMHEDYIRPQENSSHYGCKGAKLEGKYVLPMYIDSNKDFSLQVSEYTQEELEMKGHNYELEKSDSTILCIDYKMSGIGSQSCGPRLLEKYQFNEEEFDYQIALCFSKPDIKSE